VMADGAANHASVGGAAGTRKQGREPKSTEVTEEGARRRIIACRSGSALALRHIGTLLLQYRITTKQQQQSQGLTRLEKRKVTFFEIAAASFSTCEAYVSFEWKRKSYRIGYSLHICVMLPGRELFHAILLLASKELLARKVTVVAGAALQQIMCLEGICHCQGHDRDKTSSQYLSASGGRVVGEQITQVVASEETRNSGLLIHDGVAEALLGHLPLEDLLLNRARARVSGYDETIEGLGLSLTSADGR
jgi:hypothetical protein